METKELIKELFKVKPKRIREIFNEHGVTPLPSDVKLRNHLVQIRKEFCGPAAISLGELENRLNISSTRVR